MDLNVTIATATYEAESDDSAEAATEEPAVAVGREFEPSQTASVQQQLAVRDLGQSSIRAVGDLSQSFLPDLFKLTSTQASHSFIESGTHPQSLLSKGKGLCHLSDENKWRRISEDRKGQSGGRRSGEEGLSEELVELILSRIPFPYIFKVRGLSRSWYFKFPSHSVRSLQPSFQNHISSVSSQWPTYCPVFVGQKRFLLCFDQISSTWKRMLSVPHFPTKFPFKPDGSSCCMITSAGPLLAIFLLHFSRPFYATVIVNNVISKSWRRLPPLKEVGRSSGISYPKHFRVLQVDHNIYEVLLVFEDLQIRGMETHVYDSRLLDQWTATRTHRIFGICGRVCSNSAYLENKLYCLVVNERHEDPPLTLWTYRVEDGAWLVTVLHSWVHREDITDGAIFVCKEKVMVAIWSRNRVVEKRVRNTIRIFQLDLQTELLAKVCKGPPILNCRDPYSTADSTEVNLHMSSEVGYPHWDQRGNTLKIRFSAGPDHMYFVWNHSGTLQYPMVAYNVQTHVWSSLPSPPRDCDLSYMNWVETALQPGLNPFAVV